MVLEFGIHYADCYIVSLVNVWLHFQALVHVSTAYCNCNRQEVRELVYPPPADPEKIMQCVEWMEDDLLATITPKQVVSIVTILGELWV
jgi:fatty acyl-CoA reductase